MTDNPKQYRTKTAATSNAQYVTRTEWAGNKYRTVTRDKNTGYIISASKWRTA